jgi:hypothetical protein
LSCLLKLNRMSPESWVKQRRKSLLGDMLNTRPVETIINDVENLKINYYKKHKAEIERKRKAFVEQGGELEDFKVEDDPHESEIKELLRKYRELKADYNKVQEEHKHKNLKKNIKLLKKSRNWLRIKNRLTAHFRNSENCRKNGVSLVLSPSKMLKTYGRPIITMLKPFMIISG